MNAKAIAIWRLVKSSYWFIPTLMALIAILVSMASIQVDVFVPDQWIGRIGFLNANEPQGARILLSTIAGSMIGVAGITFSITIAAVAFASAQFGPRILTNFMRDRANQVTLGVFVSTFLYCLLILRTIQSNNDSAFIPHFSILIGVLLSMASIGVLIHFIHHIAESIHVSTVMARVGSELLKSAERLFPQQIGHRSAEGKLSDAEADAIESRFKEGQAARVVSQGTGYVQALAAEKLMETAQAHDVVVRLERQPGDFTAVNRTLMWVWPAARANEDVLNALSMTIAIGTQRTPDQDIRFLVEQLTDMAGRALSPGINDPYTAASCMHWLGATISLMANREAISAYRYGEDGQLRVVASPITFEYICDAAFGSVRQHVERNRVAAERMMTTIYEVLINTTDTRRRAVLVDHAAQLMSGVERQLSHAADVAGVGKQYSLIGSTKDVEVIA